MADLKSEWDNATPVAQSEWDQAIPIGQKDTKMSWGDIPGKALGNLVPSGINVVKGMIQPFVHPVQTVEGISKVARGALGINAEEAPAWEATKQFFADRYGGIENLKKTMAEDPAGFAMDLSTLLTAGGSLAAKAPGTVGKIGSAASTIGEAVNPVTAPIRAGVGIANKVAGSGIPGKLYTSALKPSTALSTEERLKRVQTALTERIPVTEKGLAQLEEGISGLNKDVSQLVATSSNQGKFISKTKVLDGLDKLDQFYVDNYADPRPYTTAVGKLREGILITKPDKIPVGQAQSIKQSIYREIKDAYDAAKRAGTTPELSGGVQGRKALARSVKEEIENIIPEIKDLNARESRMINLEESVERAVGRINNWDLLGLAAPVVGAAAGMTPTSKIATTLAYRVIGNPTFKSHLAIALSKTRKVPSSIQATTPALRAVDILNPQQ